MWRYVPAGGEPLHVGHILKAAGRWNRQGLYGCLYTSLTLEGVRAEFTKVITSSGISASGYPPQEAVLLAASIGNVLDLSDQAHQRRVGADLNLLTLDTPAALAHCRDVADRARKTGHQAILSASAARPGALNLNIYVDGPASAVQLEYGGRRVLLNP